MSVSLSSGSRALARKRVLVKRLVTIEDLGNIEILFTDKTGTLTEGAITFHAALDAAGAPSAAAVASRPGVQRGGHDAHGPGRRQRARPAPCDGAEQAPALLRAPDGPRAYERLGVLPFDHERQLATVLAAPRPDAPLLVTKGAPEAVLARCVGVRRREPAQSCRACSTTAHASSPWPRARLPAWRSSAIADERDLHLEGFLTFVDRPKADAGASIAKLAHLGVAVKIITGDNGAVAAKVCRDLGLAVEQVLTGADIDHLDDRRAAGGDSPHHRLRAREPRAEVAHHQGRAHGSGATSPSWATGSTTPSRCTRPTSASRWTRPPTWPRTPPTSSCSRRTSASWPTA